MDLLDLELVVAVADCGSITHGAERVPLSLPSASARIRGMERALGVSLFDRDRRGVSPTPAGVLLVRHARRIRRAVHEMRDELAELADGQGGTVRLLANTAAADSLTGPLGAFLAANPRVRVDIEERPSHRIVAAVAERRAELGIVADSVDLGELKTLALRVDPLVVTTSPGDPLVGRSAVSYADVLDHPFVGLSHGSALQEHLEGHALPLGSRPTYLARLPTIDAVCQVVAAGVGIAILPRRSIERWIAEGALEATELDDRWARRNLVLCYNADHELSATARALRDHLASTADADADGVGGVSVGITTGVI
ncbi:LysR family transcriptional regulator [Nocardioides sp. NPDC051685]|uniref:LysR family transcriptional regulator n=1 Tax=Nocardioides sp. NPDC051685 TaxID=3364334 RepID=UPI003797BA26